MNFIIIMRSTPPTNKLCHILHTMLNYAVLADKEMQTVTASPCTCSEVPKLTKKDHGCWGTVPSASTARCSSWLASPTIAASQAYHSIL